MQSRIKYLVTGVAGFIGTNLIIKLINEGYSIIYIDNLSNKNHNLKTIRKLINTKFYNIDISETEKLIEII